MGNATHKQELLHAFLTWHPFAAPLSPFGRWWLLLANAICTTCLWPFNECWHLACTSHIPSNWIQNHDSIWLQQCRPKGPTNEMKRNEAKRAGKALGKASGKTNLLLSGLRPQNGRVFSRLLGQQLLHYACKSAGNVTCRQQNITITLGITF